MDRQKLNKVLWIFMAVVFLVVGLILVNNLRRTEYITLPAEDVADNENTQNELNSDGMLTVVEITPKTVQAAIATLSRPQSYRRTVQVEQFWNGGSSRTEITASVQNGWTRVDQPMADGQLRHTLTDGTTTHIWYNDEYKVFTAAAGEINADQEQMIPTYEDILLLPAEEISEADYRDYEGISCIYVETVPNAQGYVQRYWVSVESGLLVAAERMQNESCVYRMMALTWDAVQTEMNFALPDGTTVSE